MEQKNFLTQIIEEDLAQGRCQRVVTRFPPEPNGYLHIGHAKSITLNFGLAKTYRGRCHLRFDDTNPAKEEQEFVDSIREDVRWLGFDWGQHEYYASDYFDQLYEWAIFLIKKGLAYVDSQSSDEIRINKGTPTEPGIDSPYRNRSVEDNLMLFEQMRQGRHPEGSMVLRAKIDMAHPNFHLRDPVLYRIKFAHHHRTGDRWCIYPMYDFAHGQSDAIEGITHSICTLEFEVHRPLYDWLLEALEIPHRPHQYEFARLNLTYTVMSKRKLRELVETKRVDGWDDPRMPTISGMRRRGYPPEGIVNFCQDIGVSKVESVLDIAHLQFHVREVLNKTAQRRMAVFDPVKLILLNYPEGKTELLEAENNPEDPNGGQRLIPFGKELWIERDDYREVPPKGWFRLAPGAEVRLKHAYYVKVERAVYDEGANLIEIHATYDPQSRGGWTNDGRKVKGTIHWVAVHDHGEVEVREYDHLFTVPDPESHEEDPEPKTYLDFINKDSLKIIKGVKVEPSLLTAKPGERFQFLRKGYYVVDSKNTLPQRPVFNSTVGLKDSWVKLEKKLEE